jgi:hypothetical protein
MDRMQHASAAPGIPPQVRAPEFGDCYATHETRRGSRQNAACETGGVTSPINLVLTFGGGNLVHRNRAG